ncbi:hypothetical protein B0A49_03357 [Cryomyces minteri]|uniref:RNA-dependent RNA polymerase n=1 Tax=Cryomyces minteri TaxID=331657 RepID=A0A4U0XE10_9PEZI|nr:hypothetical protein B0A49_03357 [Cryomyces minteri]
MDLFFRSIPAQSTEKQVKDFLRQPLRDIGVHVFHLFKPRNKGFAILTVADVDKAHEFLQRHGIPRDGIRHASPRSPLIFCGSRMVCERSRNGPSEVLLRHLQYEETASPIPRSSRERSETDYMFRTLLCGLWDYEQSQLVFVPHFRDFRRGEIKLGQKSLAFILHGTDSASRIDVPYYFIDGVVTGNYHNPTLSLTLKYPPKFYEVAVASDITHMLSHLMIAARMSDYQRNPKKIRVPRIGEAHEGVASTCFVYRITLVDHTKMERLYQVLASIKSIPQTIPYATSLVNTQRSFATDVDNLTAVLRNIDQFGQLPFRLRYQVQRLAWNGILPPATVAALLPTVARLVHQRGEIAATDSVRQLADQVPFSGPETDARSTQLPALSALLEDNAGSFVFDRSTYDYLRSHSSYVLVHRVTVTPAGNYLEGPSPEVGNRVLRKYPERGDYFIRVTFADEDGEQMRFDPQSSLHDIYERFKELLKKVWQSTLSQELKPSALQIRFSGYKGMVSVDTRLEGETLCLRESMRKFDAHDAMEIEICGTNSRSLPMYLNRPLIKILEDLGVSPDALFDLQADVIENLRTITMSPINAASFLERSHVGKSTRTPFLIRALSYLGFDFRDDYFLRDTVEMAVLAQLRDLKHRSRIIVEQGVTLYGIMDETGILEEGEIYVVTESRNRGRKVLTGGKVVITRAPAMHPGDVQVVKAVDVPADSPLNALHNCVVFSAKGERDLPSMLSGGDLDGDLYNVIYDARLMPTTTYKPADYPRVPPLDIGREVNKEDIANFFVEFLATDRLGQISTIHQQLADQHPEWTLHLDCVKLAGMASTAVDFSKTGIPVDMDECPRHNNLRPDFMAHGPRVLIEDGVALAAEAEEDDDDPVSALDPDARPYRYYESNKVLGQLYRAIDEKSFFEEMQSQSRSSVTIKPGLGSQTLMDKLWDYVQRETSLIQWEHRMELAREIRETYEANLEDTMYQFSLSAHSALSELEVFSGTILGKAGGAQNRRAREYNSAMKERFDSDVAYTVERIARDDNGGADEALETSVACLRVALTEPGKRVKRVGALKSFTYVVAAMCLFEIERFQERYRCQRRYG